jgi:magnesium-transporting ATPase (P-type)
VIKAGYLSTIEEITAYYLVDLSTGLSNQNALERINKFGQNTDYSLSSDMAQAHKTWVIRQGNRQRIASEHLALGDIVLLEPGNRVPADIRLVEVDHLMIDESNLTGNSLPVPKNTFTLRKETEPGQQKSIAFSGTFVVSGSGKGIIIANASNTLMAKTIKPFTKKSGGSIMIRRRLKRLGVLVNHPQAISILKKIDLVVVDADISTGQIADLIHKVQLVKKIPIKFVVDDTLARELKGRSWGQIATVKNIHKDTADLNRAIQNSHFIEAANQQILIQIVGILKKQGQKVLWVTDGCKTSPVIRAANISLVIGEQARDDVVYYADLYAPKTTTDIITRILYNKK